jgi:hypothetical protein
MADTYPNAQGRPVVLALIETIENNKAYLSEIDGKIGDGDHGINMAKGFGLVKDRLGDKEVSLSEGLGLIGKTLMTEIGGSMGPIYGTFFIQMSLKSKGKPQTDAQVFGEMLQAARSGLEDLGGARVGDKTIMDTLIPKRGRVARRVKADGPSGRARQGIHPGLGGEDWPGEPLGRTLTRRSGCRSHFRCLDFTGVRGRSVCLGSRRRDAACALRSGAAA